MKKTALLIMIITILSKFLGFMRDITLSYFFGAAEISDAYLVSQVIPLVIFSFIGTGLAAGYIPIYSQIEIKYGEGRANNFTNNLINIIFLIATFIILVGLVFTTQIVTLFASGFEGETFEVAVKFTKISLFSIYFMGLVYIFNALLQIKKNYFIPAFIGVPLNIFLMLSICLSYYFNILYLAIGSVIATASQLIILIPAIRKINFKYSFAIDIKDQNVREIIHIALPLILGLTVNQINVLVDRTIASEIAVGGISALNYANRLNLFVFGIFVSSITTVMYPVISKMFAEKNIVGIKKSLSESICSISLLVIPATVGAMLFSTEIVKLLFGRGAFNESAITMTSSALFFYSIGMIGYGLREVFTRVFYSMKDSKTPMINAAIAVILNIILNIILSRYLGIGGLALATSISAIITTGLMGISLRNKIGPFGIKHISISLLKILIASIIMGVISKLSYNYFTSLVSQNLSFVVAIMVGAVSYFLIVSFMKIEDVDVIVNKIKGRLCKQYYN